MLNEVFNEMYPDLHHQLDRLVRMKARKLARYMPVEDAEQEGRMAMVRALKAYDCNKANGSLECFVGACLDNAFRAVYAKCVAQRRMPRVAIQDGEGYTLRPTQPSSLDAMNAEEVFPSCVPSPESGVADMQESSNIRSTLCEIRETLTQREASVLTLMMDPPPEVEDGGRATNIGIARYMGLTKNQVDYAVQKVRRAILERVHAGAFSPEVTEAVARSGAKWRSVDS